MTKLSPCLALLLLANACGSPTPAPPDAPRADAPLGDASLAGCAPLELGLCTLAGSGAPCVGASEEAGRFTPVTEATVASLVLGPQGARMLVLAARTRGIEPGDPARPTSSANPVVEIRVTDTRGHELTSYRGRAAFVPDAEDPTLLVQPEIFVIMEGEPAAEVHVLATLRDRAGAERCGALRLLMPR